MMKFFTKLLLISILFSLYNSAQAQTVEYKTENYTQELAPLKISISPLSFENFISPITAGVMAEGYLKKKFFYNVQFRLGYVRNFTIDKEKLVTTQKESKGSFFEAGIDFPFYNKAKPSKLKVVTNTVNYGNSKHESYFKAVCEKRIFWSLSGGVMQYGRARYNNSETSNQFIANGVIVQPGVGNFTHYNQNTFAAFAGISKRRIKKAIINSNGTNYRRFYSTKFYAHILFGATSMGDVVIDAKVLAFTNAKQSTLGYRMGWQWDEMGVVTGFEFGKMPEIRLETPIVESEISQALNKNPFNYVRFTFQFVIFNNDKNYKLKARK